MQMRASASLQANKRHSMERSGLAMLETIGHFSVSFSREARTDSSKRHCFSHLHKLLLISLDLERMVA
jgi:hypothetical protein